MKKFIIKKLIPIILVLIICVPLVACTPQGDEPGESTKSDDTSGAAAGTTTEEPTKNELICKNEDVGEAWKKYVLDYEENVEFVNVYPPTEFDVTSSIYHFEFYKLSEKDALDSLMSILMEIGDYATEENQLENKGSYKCSILFNSDDPQNFLGVALYDNMISITSEASFITFITNEDISELVDEIMQIAEDKGVFITK